MRARLLALASVVVLVPTAVAAAAPSLRPAAATPDPAQMVLRASDLHAKVRTQRYFHDAEFPSTISYRRSFGKGRFGTARLLHTESLAEVGANAQTTARLIALVRSSFASGRGSLTLEKSFAREIGDPEHLNATLRVGHVRNLGAGPGSFELPATVDVGGERVEIHVAVFHVERLLGALGIVGAPMSHVSLATMTRLAKVMAKRMAAELVPKNVAVPVVSGVPQIGQTLVASSGLWNGSPTRISYRWQRCNAAGGACATIAGANAQTYVLIQADAGSRISVSVTARNRYGAATVRSAATAPVGAAAAPTNTGLPTITGTAQAGQTLTASTGSWSGDPTSFAFQWQRCDVAGNGCVAISGATAGTYVVAAADSGARLRVAVTATNATGSATAVSAPTAQVP
jgi:hypothetical protein